MCNPKKAEGIKVCKRLKEFKSKEDLMGELNGFF